MQPDDLPLCLYFEYGNVVGVLLSAVSFFTIWLRAAESAVFVRFFFFLIEKFGSKKMTSLFRDRSVQSTVKQAAIPRFKVLSLRFWEFKNIKT